ncbi:MAG TPA: tetratricopeptide repeat protein [Candidatus Limnocylindria bacterium]|jgi:tetratricopeptide (TPR) repeat protein|nr:tetratricopeptide repeat protein [Candidatus Limnocylindria bacterium]
MRFTPNPAARRPGLLSVVLLALVLIGAAGCGGTSSAETTSDPLSRGLQAHLAGRLDEATAAYFEALRQDPRNKFAYFDLGQIAHISKRPVEAESYYRIALSIDPSFGPALFNLAILRFEAGAAPEAIDLYQTLLAESPNYAAAHYNLGVALRSIGKQNEGDAEIAQAIRLDKSLAPPATAPDLRPGGTP